MIQFLWYVTPIVRKKAQVAALQSVAVRRSTGNIVVVTLTAVIFSFLSPLFFLRRNLWQVVGLICHRHCRKKGWYSDTVFLICHTHIQKIWQGSWPDMSRTLSENGMIQWHSLPDLSHTLSENGIIYRGCISGTKNIFGTRYTAQSTLPVGLCVHRIKVGSCSHYFFWFLLKLPMID